MALKFFISLKQQNNTSTHTDMCWFPFGYATVAKLKVSKAVQLFLPVGFLDGCSDGVLVRRTDGFKLGALVGCAVCMTKYYCAF